MDELDIAGKQYISTRRAGKEHGYHSDYIGQLIRGGKVTGQKVGRAWYVEAASLAAYLGKAYSAPESKTPVVESTKPLDTISDQPKKIEIPAVEQAPTLVKEEKIAVSVTDNLIGSAAASTTESDSTIKKDTAPIVESNHEERVVPIHTASVQTSSAAIETEGKNESPQGLRYIADDAPLLPHVQTMHSFNEVPMAQAAVAFAPQKRKGVAFAAVLASAALIAAVLGTGLSVYLSSVVQVVGETANVYYAIGK